MFALLSLLAVLGLLPAGVILLLYGVRLIAASLQHVDATWVQRAQIVLTRYPLVAFGAGLVGTAVMQSSGALSALLIGLVSARLLPLTTAIAMLLGANVGSTVVVQLLALHITDYALELVGMGAVVALVTRRTAFHRLGQVLFAFGLVVLGLALLQMGSRPLAASPVTIAVLKVLGPVPSILMIVGAILAAVLSSSAAALGLVIVLASNGSLSPVAALALMLGANIGTTTTAMLTALSGGDLVGRRLALIHTGTKVVGAGILLVVLHPLAAVLTWVWPHPATQVAIAHFGFNLALAAIFVPLARPLACLMEGLVPEQANTAGEICVFRPTLAPTPAVALAHVMQATQGMTEMVPSILEHSRLVFDDLNARTRAALQGLPDELPAVVQGFSIYRARSGIPRTMASRAPRKIDLDAKRAMFTYPSPLAHIAVILLVVKIVQLAIGQ